MKKNMVCEEIDPHVFLFWRDESTRIASPSASICIKRHIVQQTGEREFNYLDVEQDVTYLLVLVLTWWKAEVEDLETKLAQAELRPEVFDAYGQWKQDQQNCEQF